jgi:hypothetical protein
MRQYSRDKPNFGAWEGEIAFAIRVQMRRLIMAVTTENTAYLQCE